MKTTAILIACAQLVFAGPGLGTKAKYEKWNCDKCNRTPGFKFCKWDEQFLDNGGCLPTAPDDHHDPCGAEEGDKIVNTCPERDEWYDPVVDDFYYAWFGGNTKQLTKQIFASEGIYEHTGQPSARGKKELKALFKTLGKIRSPDYRVVDVQQAGRDKVVIVFRDGFRDKMIITNEEIKLIMTTRADPNDADLRAVTQAVQLATDTVSDPKKEKKAVQAAVNDYFHGFMGHRGDLMADAFVQQGLYMMYDLNPERKVPFACAMSADCGTAPFMSTQEVLRQATAGFANGYINLNHKFKKVKLMGSELAYATTITYGCEGDAVTPAGTKPMPNRELFVLVKTQVGWKIKTYFFTFDPASPLTPPVAECTDPKVICDMCSEKDCVGENKCYFGEKVGIFRCLPLGKEMCGQDHGVFCGACPPETKTQTSRRIINKFLANTGNPDVLRSIMSPTLTYVSLNFRNDNLTQIMPWAGTHPNNGEALIQTFSDVSKYWIIDAFNPVDIIAQDEKVAVFGNFTYTSYVLGKTVTSPFAINARLSEGKLVYMMFMEDTLITSQSFWKSGQRTYVSNPDTMEEVVF